MIPGTKTARKSARQTAAEVPAETHEEKKTETLDRRAAMAAVVPAMGDALVKFLRASNGFRHTLTEEWKKNSKREE